MFDTNVNEIPGVAEPQSAICGNGVVEVGEECDCGWEEDCRDECCFPQRRYPPPEEPPCRLTPQRVCSPSQVCNTHITELVYVKNKRLYMHLDVSSDINRNTYLLTNKFCGHYFIVAADSSLLGCDAYQASRSEHFKEM